MSQLGKIAFQTLYGSTGTTFPDNTTGLISEADIRQFGQDIKDSLYFFTDDSYHGAKGVTPGIDSITGLRAVATTSILVGAHIIYREFPSGYLRVFKIASSSAVDNGVNIIRPNDWTVSDPKVWFLADAVSRYVHPNISTITALKAIPTFELINPGQYIIFRDTGSSNALRVYEMVVGSDAESSPNIIRPDDYATTTNEKVWKLADVSVSLGYTAENVANKATDFTTLNNTLYPSVQAVENRILSALAGLKWKEPVVIATTANITLSGEQTIDGVLTSTSRILVKSQSTQSENGIYITGAGAWTRATDADLAAELEGATVTVQQGTVNENTTWTQTTDGITLGSSNIIWAQFGSSVPDATDTVKGIAKLYDTTGVNTDGSMDQASITTELSGRQPIDSDLTAISGLTPSNDDIIQRKAGAWTNRTIAQYKSDLGVNNYVTPEQYGAVGDGSTDDSTAINNAIASGIPVYFGQKNYRVNSTITTTDNTYLFGSGSGSIISTTANIAIITIGGIMATIENLQLLGSGSGASQNGITAVGNGSFNLYRYGTKVINCFFNDLGNAGMYTTNTIGNSSGSEHQGTYYAVNCRAFSCSVGYFMDTRGEYNIFVNCLADNNTTGVRFNGGNNSWTGGNIVDNTTNVVIGSGTNDGHGVITGAKINHGGSNVTCTSTATGFAFVGCEIVAGSITLTSCTDIRFYNCDISSAPITSTSAVGTIFAGNCFRTTPTITIAAGNNPSFLFNTFPAASTVHSLIVNSVQGGISVTQQGPTSPNTFTSTWTTTANNQYADIHTGTITPRATASDVTNGKVIDIDFIATASNQRYNQLSIVGTMANGSQTGTELNALNVVGRTKITDSASTGTLGTLELIDSSGNTISKWSADGIQRIGGAGAPINLFPSADGSVISKTGNALVISTGSQGVNLTTTSSGAGAAGAHSLRATGGMTTTSGALGYTALVIDPTYNQAGGTGNATGIDYNPTVTALAGTHYGILSRPTGALNGFGTATPTATLHTVGTTKLEGLVTLPVAGNGIAIKEGTNATMGVATLSGGTVTVNTTKVTANSRIFLTVNGGTLTNVGSTYISARVAATSFTITSTNVLDTSDIAWLIIEPA